MGGKQGINCGLLVLQVSPGDQGHTEKRRAWLSSVMHVHAPETGLACWSHGPHDGRARSGGSQQDFHTEQSPHVGDRGCQITLDFHHVCTAGLGHRLHMKIAPHLLCMSCLQRRLLRLRLRKEPEVRESPSASHPPVSRARILEQFRGCPPGTALSLSLLLSLLHK